MEDTERWDQKETEDADEVTRLEKGSIPLPSGWLKCNVGGAWNGETTEKGLDGDNTRLGISTCDLRI
ncbi:unnamed protein product [Arabis nemorensis]|uniref:Uncharacterized protein n=1 Tax=Arabis nemorensis TaxID=586526 RepID=A0A565CQ94_9BRAS|nr:unnamed protein product [Arabis nemorensis]